MTHVDRREFDRACNGVVDLVMRFWTPEMQSEIARHNAGWARGRTDFEVYLRASSTRFWRAYVALNASHDDSVCDVGGFWGVWPLTLRSLGHTDVSMTEALHYYSDAFDPLFDHVRQEGVQIVDADVFSDDGSMPLGTFDHVTLLAVLEHIPHSLERPIGRIKSMMGRGGQLYIEVPNIAYWPKRVGLLRGRSPLPPIEDIYDSATPFIGHHHEYSPDDLERLCELAGLRIVSRQAFNYSWSTTPAGRILDSLRHPLASLAFVSPRTREIIAVLCEDE